MTLTLTSYKSLIVHVDLLKTLAALPHRDILLASHAIFSLELLSCRQENPCHTLAYEHCHTLSSHTFNRVTKSYRQIQFNPSPGGIVRKSFFGLMQQDDCQLTIAFCYPFHFGNFPAALWRGVRSTEMPLNREITLHCFSREICPCVCT